MKRLLLPVMASMVAVTMTVLAQQQEQFVLGSTNQPSVFVMPALQEYVAPLRMELARQIHEGNLEKAAELSERLIKILPFASDGYYNLGCLRALQGRNDEAFDWLGKAVDHGFLDSAHIEKDADLKGLWLDPRFKELVQRAARLRAEKIPTGDITNAVRRLFASVSNGVAWVSASNTIWEGRANILVTFFNLGESNAGQRAICTVQGEAGDLLRTWWKEGTAAGNWGDLYDNRDSDHSNMDYAEFPQLTRIEYAPDAIASKVHFGPQAYLFHNGVVLGNSSTANVGSPFWRSLPRQIYCSGRGAQMLAFQYLGNKVYIYPEHNDFDPGHNGKDGGGYGDVFPCNTPYLITTKGSSGSDRVFLNAVAATLAGFRPAVKQSLGTNGLLMATVQMILRSSSKVVPNEKAYLSGVAHPAAFDGANLDVSRMVRMAHAMTPTNLPPLVMLKVEEEERFKVGRDYFDAGDSEAFFDSPCAIARIWRATSLTRKLVVSAVGRDVNARKLSFHWVVLQGDPAKVRIRKLDPTGSKAEITFTWQGRYPVASGSKLESNRIEIGVFVHNGTFFSAPAFITYYTLDNELRKYDIRGRIAEMRYTGADEAGNYTDPMLDRPKSWRDVYHYDSTGVLTGWTRHRGTTSEEFSPEGRLIVKRDKKGQVLESRAVRYVVKPRGQNEPAILVQETALAAPPAPVQADPKKAN